MNRSRFALLIAPLLFHLLFAATSAQGDRLVVALSSDPTALFLPRAADRTATNASLPLYDSLVWINDDLEIEPALAERWEVSADGTEYRFHLRRGVTFHNGEPFTSASVIATWVSGSDPSNDYANFYNLANLVEAIDDYTVRITTPEPNATFLTTVAISWGMVPPRYIAEVGLDAFNRNPIGTGPFRFVSRTPGDRILYAANPDYWRAGYPKVAELEFRVIPDASTRLAAIQTGEIHIANRLTPDQARALANARGVEVVSYLNDRAYYVGFKNVGAGVGTPLEDVRVRQALNYGSDRFGIIAAIFVGEAQPIPGFVIQGNLGYDAEAMPPFPYDPERARALLSEAGYPGGFSISMGCPADGYVNINEVCLALQRSLARIGVEVNVEFRTTNSFWSEAQYGAVGAMFVDSWSSTIGEALPRLTGALIPGNYYTAWEDPELAALIERIGVTVDRDARAGLYAQLHTRMRDDPPFIYLYQPTIFEAISERVSGYRPRAAEEYYLFNVALD
jgi:peptide/nickel transport system substrate-binding protein